MPSSLPPAAFRRQAPINFDLRRVAGSGFLVVSGRKRAARAPSALPRSSCSSCPSFFFCHPRSSLSNSDLRLPPFLDVLPFPCTEPHTSYSSILFLFLCLLPLQPPGQRSVCLGHELPAPLFPLAPRSLSTRPPPLLTLSQGHGPFLSHRPCSGSLPFGPSHLHAAAQILPTHGNLASRDSPGPHISGSLACDKKWLALRIIATSRTDMGVIQDPSHGNCRPERRKWARPPKAAGE